MRRIAVVLLLLVGSAGLPASASPVIFPPALGLMDSDGTHQRLVGEYEGYGSGRVSWSPDSLRLAVDGVTIIDTATGEATALTGGRSPDWSPTGDDIVFSRAISNETYDEKIYLISTAGGEPRLLVDTPLLDTHPSWSPDGARIAFVSGPGSGDPGTIHIVDRDGSDLRPLPSHRALYVAPEWSPDSRYIVYETFDYRLRIIDLETNTDQELAHFEHSSQPTWCPDGTLYFVGQPELMRAIYSLHPGSSPSFVTQGVAPDCRRDGKLAFSLDGDIHIVDPHTAGTPNLTDSPNRSDSEPRWSPDGTKIAWSSQEEIPPPTRVERDVTLSLRRHLTARGSIASDPDSASCPARVRLQKLRTTGWRTIKSGDVAYGQFRVKLPDRPGFYRAVVPRSWDEWGAVVCTRAVSPIRRHRH